MMSDHIASASVEELADQLNSFNPTSRHEALTELARRLYDHLIHVPASKNEVNLHYHTFFSYNAEGWSPSRVAWEAKNYGLAVAGIVDFDVLDGMEEFLAAGEIIDLKSTTAMETRVFINEYADDVISSPNEPGIAYFMAAGCVQLPALGSKADEILRSLREMAKSRNLQVMERVNDYLDVVRLDYNTDVLPLTPSGNATERHLLAAYDAKSRRTFRADPEGLISFWANKLEVSKEDAEALLADIPKFHEKIRSKLMKLGGVGYVPPTQDTFPTIERVIEMTNGMGALPMATWLDGTNPGEADMSAMLELLASKGVVAINIIPDRNWNIKKAEEKKIKVENLEKAIQAARDIDFPICVGTEMNKAGLPFVDDFSAPELQPYIDDFINGAYFLWGHTFLARNSGIGYASDWSKTNFGEDRKKKNAFYTKVGRLADPIKSKRMVLGKDLKSKTPEEVIRILSI